MNPRHQILICDDDPLLIELMSFRLRAKGFDVISAMDAARGAGVEVLGAVME